MADETKGDESIIPVADEPKLAAVIATQVGALPVQGLVKVGDKFSIPPEQFSESWMRPASAAATKLIAAARRAKPQGDGE
jgi:hypothetical protein